MLPCNPIRIFKVPVLYIMGYFLGGIILGFLGTTWEEIWPFIAVSFFTWVVGSFLLYMEEIWPTYFSTKTAVGLMVGSAMTLVGGFLLANFLTNLLRDYLL